MASVRMQILTAVKDKVDLVAETLGWPNVLVNPREPIGEDQFNAIVIAHGGEPDPSGLTGHVGMAEVEFSVALLVQEAGGRSAEELLDAGWVALSNALLDPADIQLGKLAIGIRRGGIEPPTIGRAMNGARIIGGQQIDFTVQYLEIEGDAETPGP